MTHHAHLSVTKNGKYFTLKHITVNIQASNSLTIFHYNMNAKEYKNLNKVPPKICAYIFLSTHSIPVKSTGFHQYDENVST